MPTSAEGIEFILTDDGQRLVTRAEAKRVLRVSRYTLDGLEADEPEPARLHRIQYRGRFHYELEEVETLRAELAAEFPAEDTGDTKALERRGDVHLYGREEPGAQLVRAAGAAAVTNNNQSLKLMELSRKMLQDSHARTGKLEAERGGLYDRAEKAQDRSAERELEKMYVLHLMGKDSTEQSELGKTLAPLIPVLANRIAGVKANPKEPARKMMKGFIDSLEPQQIDDIMDLLSQSQKTALLEITMFVKQAEEKEGAKAKEKEAKKNGK